MPRATALWFNTYDVTVKTVERFEFSEKFLEVAIKSFLIGHVFSVCKCYPSPFGRVYNIGVHYVPSLFHRTRNRFEVIRAAFLMIEFLDLTVSDIDVFVFRDLPSRSAF